MSEHDHSHSHGHSHAHIHSHEAGKHRWRLQLTFIIVAIFFIIELTVGIITGALTLLGDAGHMGVDVFGLGVALFATRLASKPDKSGRRTYGHYRAEVFSAGLSVLLMYGVAIYVIIEAISRWGHSHDLAAGPMLIIGVLGLAINIASLVLLHGGSQTSLNIKGAYLEVLADALGSVAIIISGVLTYLTHTSIWDSLIASALAIFILFRATMLGREVMAVLGQHAPPGIDPKEAIQTLSEVPGVEDVHDLHLWTLTSGMNVATAHLVSAEETEHCRILADASKAMRERFGIEHATLQVESAEVCHRTDW